MSSKREPGTKLKLNDSVPPWRDRIISQIHLAPAAKSKLDDSVLPVGDRIKSTARTNYFRPNFFRSESKKPASGSED